MPSTAVDLGLRYASYWSKDENEKRTVPGSQIEGLRRRRQQSYKDIARDYYDLTTDNIEFGWNTRFHFCPFTDPDECIDTAMKQHEHFLALMMSLKPGMRGLDVGCGIGAPSRDLVRFVDVHITGISINKLHIERAREQASEAGLAKKLEYVEGDFMDMSRFPDNSFDFAYATEATVYAPDLAACYVEIARVLKPDGVFGVYEWLMTDSFDTDNPEHLNVRQRLERGDGITNILTIREGLEAFRSSGLELFHHEDRAEGGLKDKRWWYVINGEANKTTTWGDWWLATRLKKRFWQFQCVVVWYFENLGVMKKGRFEALKTQSQSVWGNRDGAQMGIFTPMYMMVGRKPLSA